MHFYSKIPFATISFLIILYASLLICGSRGTTNDFYESHIILSSYLKLALKYTASSTILEKINSSKSSLSSLTLIGLHIPDIPYGNGAFDSKVESRMKETHEPIKSNAFQNFLEQYHFFSLHDAFSGDSGDLEVTSACYKSFLSCPHAACSVCSQQENFNKSKFHGYARHIVASKFLNFDMGTEALLKRFAYGLVLLNTGHTDRSVEHFARLLKEYPNQPEALAAMAVAKFRMNSGKYGAHAVQLMDDALRMQSRNTQLLSNRGLMKFLLGDVADARADLTAAVGLERNCWRLLLQRCVISVAMGDKEAAFQDAKAALRLRRNDPNLLLLLGRVYERLGRFRNAVETYKEALEEEPSMTDARLRLADCHRVLGSADRVHRLLAPLLSDNGSSRLSPDNAYAASKLLAMSHYAAGDMQASLHYADTCLSLHPTCPVCLFRRAASLANAGQFYSSIRSATAIMVQASDPAVAASPEFLRSHFLREWARHLHARLEAPFASLNFTRDLQRDFLVRWILGQSLAESKSYKEMSGLQPNLADVTTPHLSSYTFPQQELICLAKRVSLAFRSDSDGAWNSRRGLFALGLATVHAGQLIADSAALPGNASGMTWRSLIELVAKYAQLADLSRPVQPVHSLPTETMEAMQLHFVHQIVRADVPNPSLQNYFGLVFQLAKTMTEHSRGPEGGTSSKREFETAQTLNRVLAVAKQRRTYRKEDSGLVVGTQVPSTKWDRMRHEGAYIYLTEDSAAACSLGVRLRLRQLRLRSYGEELDCLMRELLSDIADNKFHSADATKVNENLVTRTLTLLYYLTNAMPLSHKSGPVSFSVALAVLLSAGVTAQGRLPPGKSLELEPVLAGTPDAFALVTRQWLKPAPAAKPIGQYARVESVCSSLRSVMEILNAGAAADCPA